MFFFLTKYFSCSILRRLSFSICQSKVVSRRRENCQVRNESYKLNLGYHVLSKHIFSRVRELKISSLENYSHSYGFIVGLQIHEHCMHSSFNAEHYKQSDRTDAIRSRDVDMEFICN